MASLELKGGTGMTASRRISPTCRVVAGAQEAPLASATRGRPGRAPEQVSNESFALCAHL